MLSVPPRSLYSDKLVERDKMESAFSKGVDVKTKVVFAKAYHFTGKNSKKIVEYHNKVREWDTGDIHLVSGGSYIKVMRGNQIHAKILKGSYVVIYPLGYIQHYLNYEDFSQDYELD